MKEHLLEMLMNKVKEGKIASLTVSFEEGEEYEEEEMEETEEEEKEEPQGDNGGSNEEPSEQDEEKKNFEKLKEYSRKK